MSTLQKLSNAVENYFGPHDPEIKAEILDALDAHFRSPWIFSQDAQPPAGEQVLCLDPDEHGQPAGALSLCARQFGDDWTDPECVFWWMHVPPLPEGGGQADLISPESRIISGFEGGGHAPDVGALMGWDIQHAVLADAYAESEAEAATLRARCAPHKEIQAAEDMANHDRAMLLDHARAILALHDQITDVESQGNAHAWIRHALRLPSDAPHRFDFYAERIEAMQAHAQQKEAS